MRVNVDEKVLTDPRIKLAAARLGINAHELRGRLIPVWTAAYNARTAVMPRRNVDVLAEMPGFVDALVAEDLATVSSDDAVRLRGVTERIEFLLLQDAKRDRANKAKRDAAGLAAGDSAGLPPGRPAGTAETPIPARPAGDPTGRAYSLTLTQSHALTHAHAHALDQTPIVPTGDVAQETSSLTLAAPPAPAPRRARSKKPLELSDGERASAMVVLGKLSARNGVNYTGCDEHVRLIANQLRAGVTEHDLRKVVGYCAVELGWSRKPEMAQYLRPETLFGPKNIARYLDPARAWFERLPAERHP